MTEDRARLEDQRRALDPDQNDHGRNWRNRRRRVHGDAQRTMVGVAVGRMDVGHLDQGQQRQQGQTQQSPRPESAWLPAADPAQIWLNPSQQTISNLKNTELDAAIGRRVVPAARFSLLYRTRQTSRAAINRPA
jgi:hypothetical protein